MNPGSATKQIPCGGGKGVPELKKSPCAKTGPGILLKVEAPGGKGHEKIKQPTRRVVRNQKAMVKRATTNGGIGTGKGENQ